MLEAIQLFKLALLSNASIFEDIYFRAAHDGLDTMGNVDCDFLLCKDVESGLD